MDGSEAPGELLIRLNRRDVSVIDHPVLRQIETLPEPVQIDIPFVHLRARARMDDQFLKRKPVENRKKPQDVIRIFQAQPELDGQFRF